jgi:hypothetical protein
LVKGKRMTDTKEAATTQVADTPPDAKQAAASAAQATATQTGEMASPSEQPQSPQVAVKEVLADAPLDAAAIVPAAANSTNAASANDALAAVRAEQEWRVIGDTVPGASHLRAGIPNQDAILCLRQSSARLPVIVSISDGHGSNKCFRSDRGSRFAVRIGTDLLDELINGRHAALPVAELEGKVREGITNEFIKRWRGLVEADISASRSKKKSLSG